MRKKMTMVTLLSAVLFFAVAACQVSSGNDSIRLIKLKVPTCA